MKRLKFAALPGFVVVGVLFAGLVYAATQTITASVVNGNSTYGTAQTTAPSTATCLSAGGGTNVLCSVQGPGTFGTNGYAHLKVGETVSTSGAGAVTLGCSGQGSRLSCSAKVEDTICAGSKTITASARNGAATEGNTGTTGTSIITCTQASGGQYGTTCGIRTPTYVGTLAVGQAVTSSGAGNVNLGCNGTYSATGGGLSCTATVAQTCP